MPYLSLGTHGEWTGAFKFPSRPTFCGSSDYLAVADSGNHRVQVISTDGSGTCLRTFGGPGSGPGQLLRPSAVASSADGSVLAVSDYGNRRVQLFQTRSGAHIKTLHCPCLVDPLGT